MSPLKLSTYPYMLVTLKRRIRRPTPASLEAFVARNVVGNAASPRRASQTPGKGALET